LKLFLRLEALHYSTTMTNQIEMNMIKAIDKFIIYMLTENTNCVNFGKSGEIFTCGNQIIYSKLNELEDEELEEWVNEKLKNYLANGWDYEEGDIIIDNEEIQVWINGDICDIHTYDIFNGSCGEYLEMQRELIEYSVDNGCDWFSGKDMVRLTFDEDILQYYCYMYIEKMSATELKEYIINLLDPVEPK
jgi:hypothetical protein